MSSQVNPFSQLVQWNDPRVLYNSLQGGLVDGNWTAYDSAMQLEQNSSESQFYPSCGGMIDLALVNDSVSLGFYGSSVSVNLQGRWNGGYNIPVYLDGALWTTLNTSNVSADPLGGVIVQPTGAIVCDLVSITKDELDAGVPHNVTVVVPQSDPHYGYTYLFQGFSYVGPPYTLPPNAFAAPAQTSTPASSTTTLPSATATSVSSSVHHSYKTPVAVGAPLAVLGLIGMFLLYYNLQRKSRGVPAARTPISPLASFEDPFNDSSEVGDAARMISPYPHDLLDSSVPSIARTIDPYPQMQQVTSSPRATPALRSKSRSLAVPGDTETTVLSPSSSARHDHLEVIQGLLDRGVPG